MHSKVLEKSLAHSKNQINVHSFALSNKAKILRRPSKRGQDIKKTLTKWKELKKVISATGTHEQRLRYGKLESGLGRK